MAVPLRRPALVAAALVAAAAALAGCSGSGAASGVGNASSSGGAAGGAAGSAAASKVGPKPPQGADGTFSAADVQQRVVRTAQVVVQVEGELATAAAKVRAVAQTLGGTVASETTTYADAGTPGTATSGVPNQPSGRPGESLLVVRVPEPSLDRALALITGPTGVGKELSRTASAQDVTADLADLESRVATQRASVTRVRALLAKASSLQDVVTLESEVTKRESDLEAAEARRAALADQADLATLTVDLRTHEVVAVSTPARPNAFLDGLRSGWTAVTASTTVVLTVLGALLPVAVVVAVVGTPVLWWVRRRRPVRPVAPPVAPAPDAGS